jgi:hypothetical protein
MLYNKDLYNLQAPSRFRPLSVAFSHARRMNAYPSPCLKVA